MSRKIIFDFGGVLLSWDPHSMYHSYFNCPQKTKDFFEETALLQLNREFDRGYPLQLGLEELAQKFPHYREAILLWQQQWPKSIVGEVAGSVEVLTKLYQDGHELFGLTNWSAETFPYALKNYPFFSYFKDIVVSGEVKLIKPDPEIYRLLLNRNQLTASDCIFIDDIKENVLAAAELGIHAIQFTSAELLVEQLQEFGIYFKRETTDRL